jgi:subtilisin-like proprotein convertase family protein
MLKDLIKVRFKPIIVLSFLLITIFVSIQAQNLRPQKQRPIHIGLPSSVVHVPPIASKKTLVKAKLDKAIEANDGRASKYNIVIGKGSKGQDVLTLNPHRLKNKIQTKAPIFVFETAASASQPTDPAGAVGPNHYFAVINTGFRIFDKSGNPLTPILSPSPAIFPSSGCCDLTASYDNAADRWVITMLNNTAGAQVAVSTGPDPVNDGWTVYTYNVIQDYQKLSVWSDGYYMTENTDEGNKVHVFERDKMLLGYPDAQIISFNLPGIVTNGFYSPQAFNVSTDNFPAAGSAPIVYLQDDAYFGVNQGEDHIKLWTVDVDWSTPSSSTISSPTRLGLDPGTGSVSDFVGVFDGGSFRNLTQPGGQDIDALQAIIMNQAQFRKFPTHNSAVFNFVVDAGINGQELAAVRWYELRQNSDGQPWYVYQEGTYTAPDGRHAWNASLIMDIQGNIGMGYTSMSGPTTTTAVRVGSYYTGRFANDPLGTMTLAENIIIQGDANIPDSERYGDYSKIDIDPSDDKKFWFVNEVMSDGRKNIAGVFQIAPNTLNDVGVISIDVPVSGALTNAENITVTVFNYGDNDASGFNVTYQIDSGAIISEAFVGTLASRTSAQLTFNTPADFSIEGQTYTINACTDLTNDEDNTNNCNSKDITHIFANDIGVKEITAPVGGENLTLETITVIIENFGTAAQSNFDVSYTVNSSAPIVEEVPMTINPQETLEYSFSTQANMSSVGEYNITSSTLLQTDSDHTNNTATTSLSNFACREETISPDAPIGPDDGTVTESVITITDDFIVANVNVTVNIEHTWVEDLLIKLIAPDATTEVILVDRQGGDGNNFTNTVFDDDAPNSINSGSAPFTGTFSPQGSLADFNGLRSAGDWTLHILDQADDDGGNLLNWSLRLCSNESLTLDDVLAEPGITIIYKENNQFFIGLPTLDIRGNLDLYIYNVKGQILLWQTLYNRHGTGYEYNLDMSYASAGIYFVKITNGNASNIKRIIVR